MSRLSLSRLLLFGFALIALGAVLFALSALSSVEAELDEIRVALTPTPVPNYRMWSVGTGGSDGNPYIEWVALHPESSLYPIAGAPSLRFSDQAPDDPEKPRDFEIGFYKYGPTWYTRNSITEFWIGDGNGGIFSVSGNDDGGGEIQIRNPADTDSIRLNFYGLDKPTISTESGVPLHFQAREGLVSENTHTFEQGIAVPSASNYAGQVVDGEWQNGSIVVLTGAVKGDSLILITPISQPSGHWWVGEIAAGESFTVTSSSSSETMDFNWLIVAR